MRRSLGTAGGALILGVIAAGCGARSDLAGTGGHGGAATSSSSSTAASSSSSSASSSSTSASSSSSSASSSGKPPPCVTDAQCDDGIPCTKDICTEEGCLHTEVDAACDDGIPCTQDICEANLGCQNLPHNELCDDGVFCTQDACVPGAGCQSTFTDAICDDGIACTTDTCDAATDSCRHAACDNLCDNGVFCDGIERCDTTFGCTSGPPACDLELSCSTDQCSEGGQQCKHIQAATCAPPLRLLVTDGNGALRSVSPYGGPTQLIASAGSAVHYDVAILGTRWFALDAFPNRFVELVPMTNQIKKSFIAPVANSLGAGPDGMLYGAGTSIYRFDPDTGAFTMIGVLPQGYGSSGDIAFLGNRMFISADGPCGGALVEFDPATSTSTILGGDGLGCVYGLAVSAGTMFILNCDGKVGTFDPDTGEVRVLSTTGISVYGADVLP